MKKLLSLLSVLTISGTAVPTTIAASPYQKEEHNTENLIINKRDTIIDNFNINYIEKLYAQDWTKDLLRIWISKETWDEINHFQNRASNEEFKNYLILIFNQFLKTDISEVNKENQLKIVDNEDIKTISKTIYKNFFEIQSFQEKNNCALVITTTAHGQWFKNTSILSQFNNDNEVNLSSEKNFGAFKVECVLIGHDKIDIRFKNDIFKKYIENFRKLTWLDFSKWISDYINTMPREDYTCAGGTITPSDISIAVKAMKTYVFKIENNICNLREKNIDDSNCKDITLKTDRAYDEEPKIVIN